MPAVSICSMARQIAGHLKNPQHRIGAKQAVSIMHEIQQWPGMIQHPSQFEVRRFVESAIDGVAVYEDGWNCEWDVGECRGVCRRSVSMKEHWRKAYGFCAGQRRGGSDILKQEEIVRQIKQRCRRVRCQRLFVQREHSQFFEVRSDRSDGDVSGSSRGKEEQTWSQAWERASQHYNAIRADATIRAGAVDEVNPWLRRTR